jgi:hypothetical protein
MCRRSAQGDGSFRRHIRVPTKRCPTSCRPPCGLIRHPAPLRRGPLKSARSCAQEHGKIKSEHQQSAAKVPLESAWMRCLKRGPVEERALLRARTRQNQKRTPVKRSESPARERMDALPEKGPCGAAGGGGQPVGRRARCTPFFEGAWMHLRKIPPPHADLEGRSPQGAPPGCPFFWLPFLWASKEK